MSPKQSRSEEKLQNVTGHYRSPRQSPQHCQARSSNLQPPGKRQTRPRQRPPGNTRCGTGSGLQVTLDVAQAAVSRQRQMQPSQRPPGSVGRGCPSNHTPAQRLRNRATCPQTRRNRESPERHTTGPQTTLVTNLWCSKRAVEATSSKQLTAGYG
ncbi:hypothetical protein NDU88_005927 [Pleurodeles waltl]|uniref:Uncharacterized protein n=1 Tax=Pleurodeles waltl TaxID=8319 RepID=A0AAV7QMG6_PLEWA|nr:hypothetical protein NDU88_005927 [Pleurodeles waltl]